MSGDTPFPESHPLRMKFFTVPALLAATLVSVVVALPFLPMASEKPATFVLEARLQSEVDGVVRAYYDDGRGMREELSGHTEIRASAAPVAYRLALPAGHYTALRFDPLETPGRVVLHSLRATTSYGRILAELPVTKLQPVQQIETLRTQDTTLEIVTAKGANDPQLVLNLNPPLVVDRTWTDVARASAPYVLPIFGGLAALLWLLDRSPRVIAGLGRAVRSTRTMPFRAVGVVALLSTIASTYPLVFLGKSLVSPNLGTILLYDTYPTLPGYNAREVTDVKLADVGAVMWQHVPFSMIQHRALAQGELPLWNRYNALGVPLLAQGQSMFGDPLHFLVIAANGAAWAWDAKYIVARWLFALGLGLSVLALLRPRTTAPALPDAAVGAALIVAFAAPFIGFFLYRVNHPAYFSLCYAPWPLYWLIRIAQAGTRRDLAGSAAAWVVANLALMNSGTVKEAYMLLACVNFSGGCVLLAAAATWRERLLKAGVVAWAGIIFVLITAPIWGIFLQTLKNAYTGYNVVSAYQIQPTLLLGFFDEIFYRPLMEQNRVFSPSLNFLLLLGVLYFVATLRTQLVHRPVIALAASSLLPLSLAFGLVSPQWIVKLPFLGNVAHVDNTFSCALIVLWSVIAGVGFATAAQRLATPEGRSDLVLGALSMFALIFGWIAFRQAAHRPIFGPTFSVHLPGQVLAVHPFIWKYLLSLIAAAAVLALALRGALMRRHCASSRGLIIALCVAMLLWRHGLQARSVGFETFTSRPTPRVDFHARSPAIDFARAEQRTLPGRGFGFYGHFFPGWTGTYGLETIHGPDALVNPYVRELATVSGIQRLWDWRLYAEPADIGKVQPVLDALNVRFYFDLKTADPALAGLRKAHAADLDVYVSPSAWPRAFFTDRLEAYERPEQLIEKFRAAGGKPFAAMQGADPAAAAALARVPGKVETRTTTPATDYRLTENTTSFRVRSNGPGMIVLTEAFWPGDFRAELNGRKTPILRVNHAFKGVLVDGAGDYAVTLRYWPRNFPRYLLLFCAGAALAAASLFLALRPVRVRPA